MAASALHRHDDRLKEREPGDGGAGAAGRARRAGWGGGAGRSARDELWRAVLAELLATALLVLGSCLPAAAAARDPLHRALAAGAVVALLVQSFDHVSGAMMNPAVTLAAALSARVSWRRAAAYCAAQLAGAAAGAAALAALVPDAPPACVTRPAGALLGAGAGGGAGRAALLEAILAGCLALANCANWDARMNMLRDSWPLRIGVTVAALSLAAGELTGASMNPARSLGPALCANQWDQHWVYWVGPLGGAAAAALLYRAVWRVAPTPPTPATPATPETPATPLTPRSRHLDDADV